MKTQSYHYGCVFLFLSKSLVHSLLSYRGLLSLGSSIFVSCSTCNYTFPPRIGLPHATRKAETVVEGIIQAGLFSQHQLESAKEWISQSIEIAQNDGNKDSPFDATVILARILYLLGNEQDAVHSLTTMLSETTENVKQAELHFQLWKLSLKTNQGKDDHLSPESLSEHKSQAQSLYQSLSDQTKKYHYTSRLAELEV